MMWSQRILAVDGVLDAGGRGSGAAAARGVRLLGILHRHVAAAVAHVRTASHGRCRRRGLVRGSQRRLILVVLVGRRWLLRRHGHG
mgnify:CR=1 FL=1